MPSDHPSPNAPPVAPKRPVTPPKKTAPKPAAPKAVTPTTPKPEAAIETSAPETGLAFPIAEGEDIADKPNPIPPPSETLQYRAIGLVRGRYVPDVDQFTKGHMITSDGTTINTVLLGRVMSLLKKHVDLNLDHLWVVYPRTRAEDLHMQIVGIWEPETLNKTEDPVAEDDGDTSELSETTAETGGETEGESQPETTADAEPATEEATGPKVINLVKPARPSSKPVVKKAPGKKRPKPIPYHVPEDGFSIRGEVILQSKEENYVMVQIKQQPRPPKHQGKAFKLRLEGLLGSRAVGHFWDIQVLRKDDKLTILSGTSMGALPPQKRKPGQGKGRRPGGPGRGSRDRNGPSRSDQPRSSTPRPTKSRPKPQEPKPQEEA